MPGTARKAADAKPAEAQATNTADQSTNPSSADVAADREEQAKAAEKATVKVGPAPGTDEFAQEYRDTYNQLQKTNDPVSAPEGTPEQFGYEPPAKAK